MDTVYGPQYGDKADLKNIELAKLVYSLRQQLDIHRIIILNKDELKPLEMGGDFWAIVHFMALDAAVVTISKMFEYDTMNYERNSIPGIVAELTKLKIDPNKTAGLQGFCKKHSASFSTDQPAAGLCSALGIFKEKNSNAFHQLKTYRNKFASHSEHGFPPMNELPSHKEFEAIYQFSYDFYRSVCSAVGDGVQGAAMQCRADVGLNEILERLGLKNVRRDFCE